MNNTSRIKCCHDCKTRNADCHSKCKSYQEEKKAYEKHKEQIRQQKDQYEFMNSMQRRHNYLKNSR